MEKFIEKKADLQLLFCRNRFQGLEQLLRQIADTREHHHILIVPEQYSFSVERLLLKYVGNTVSRFCEVLSFSRLAQRVFSLYGGTAVRTMDACGRLLTMQHCLEELRPKLKVFSSAAAKPELVLRILSLIDDFRASCITSELLRQKEELLQGQLAVKVEELALIMDTYSASCSNGVQDPRDRLDRLADLLDREQFAESYVFHAALFSTFTEQEYRILAVLMKKGGGLHITLPCEGLLDPMEVCTPARQTAVSLIRSAERMNCSVSTGRLQEIYAFAAENMIAEELFETGQVKPYDAGDTVSIWQVDTPEQQCLLAARLIRHLAEKGARWRDISLVLCDSSMEGELKHCMDRYGIPIHQAHSDPAGNRPAAAALMSALEAVTGGMQLRDVISYLKSWYSPLKIQEADELEQYAEMWRIHGRKWFLPFCDSPAGFAVSDNEESRQLNESRLSYLEILRKKAAAPLKKLQDALKFAVSTRQQVMAFYAFLENINFEEKLRALIHIQEESGKLQEAQENAQLGNMLYSALEQIAAVLGETERSVESFQDILRTALVQYHVSSVPAALDCVTVGTPERMTSWSKHLILVGTSESTFPAADPGMDILSAGEYDTLRALELPLSSDLQSRIDRTLEGILHLFTGALDSITCLSAADHPSYLIRRLEIIFPDAVHVFQPDPFDGETVSELAAQFSCRQSADALPDEVRKMAEELSTAAGYQTGSLNRETVHNLYGSDMTVSASQIEAYNKCRFAYWLRYGLHLKKQVRAEFRQQEFGTFVHAVLEKTGRRVVQEGGFQTLPQTRVLEIAREETENYISRIRAAAPDDISTVNALGRNREEILEIVSDMRNELLLSQFAPVNFEFRFGGNKTGNHSALQVSTADFTAELAGAVDRVDAFSTPENRYIRIIDYKTGIRKFQYGDVLEGTGLQMLLYLYCMSRQDEPGDLPPLPAGVLYIPARAGILTADRRLTKEEYEKEALKQKRRSGLILKDEQIIQAMENFTDTPAYLPVRKKSADGLNGDLADREQMDRILRYAGGSVKRMLRALNAGTVRPNPVVHGPESTVCQYCDYRQVCHKDCAAVEVRNRKAVSAEEFWEKLKELEKS